MEKLKTFMAVTGCKLGVAACRLLGKGGTDKPGKLALKLCPNILSVLSKDVNTIIITGTNGKTTTSRIVEKGLMDAGFDCFANRSGANLLSGIVTTFVENATLTGKPRKKWAVIECDEAAGKLMSKYVKPLCYTALNIFRDQLDRYGEVTSTLENLAITASHIPESALCLNADCSLTWSLAEGRTSKVYSFGVNTPIYADEVKDLSDAPYCIRCKTKYEYKWHTLAHLGGWSCPNCGYSRPEPTVSVKKVISCGEDSSEIVLSINGKDYPTKVNLPGGYNIYNAAAAAAALKSAGVPDETIIGALGSFAGGFGRMEQFNIGSAPVRMILVKNPAGCNQVLSYLCGRQEKSIFVICLSDRIADGRDTSWIWDVEFEKLAEHKDILAGLWVSSVRCDEMAMRLKYAGFSEEEITVIPKYEELLERIEKQDTPVTIMPAYTAMMDLRGLMEKKYHLKKFWK